MGVPIDTIAIVCRIRMLIGISSMMGRGICFKIKARIEILVKVEYSCKK
jgi:hypothetical protein